MYWQPGVHALAAHTLIFSPARPLQLYSGWEALRLLLLAAAFAAAGTALLGGVATVMGPGSGANLAAILLLCWARAKLGPGRLALLAGLAAAERLWMY
jgi:hypothetical protein